MKTTPWMTLPGAEHCTMRCLANTDPAIIANRVAFIEKTPRVRIAPSTDEQTDYRYWTEGPKGPGGPDGEVPANELYGHHPRSQAWCDLQLKTMGYILG